MENKFQDMAVELSYDNILDTDDIKYAGYHGDGPDRWALMLNWGEWWLAEGINEKWVEDGEPVPVDFFDPINFDDFLEATLYIRKYIDSSFIPEQEDFMSSFDDDVEFLDVASTLNALEVGVPLEDIIA